MRHAVVVVTLLLFVLAVPAEALGAIRLSAVQYNSPGKDTNSNRQLNAEWIAVKNTGAALRNLRGWTIRDVAGHTYVFGNYRLRPGRTVKIHTGSGRNTARDRFWGMGWYVWNNTGDTAKLRNPRRLVIDSCRWDDGGGLTPC